jgi:diaminopimelate decarboxylase
MKSNNCPEISRILLKVGYGLDVSSGEELNQAIKLDAPEIIFSGPGKTSDELDLAVGQNDRVTVLIDSFGELERLEHVAAGANKIVRAGVRICNNENGLWRKFGIPLSQLMTFIEKTSLTPHVNFCGLQFHISWNLNPQAQVDFLRRLGKVLGELNPSQLRRITFLDIGGGYWPEAGEWLQSNSPGSAEGEAVPDGSRHRQVHYVNPAASIEDFAAEISSAIRQFIQPFMDCTIYLEPGRWLCHDAMHILLTVLDKKADDLVITDGGTNALGWERFETDYFPVINLSRPDDNEHPCLIAGSLCTPHDIWGYDYFGDGIEPEDLLLVPSQGAYTYSLRQNFIKSLPKVVIMEHRKGEEIISHSNHRDLIWERIESRLFPCGPKK